MTNNVQLPLLFLLAYSCFLTITVTGFPTVGVDEQPNVDNNSSTVAEVFGAFPAIEDAPLASVVNETVNETQLEVDGVASQGRDVSPFGVEERNETTEGKIEGRSGRQGRIMNYNFGSDGSDDRNETWGNSQSGQSELEGMSKIGSSIKSIQPVSNYASSLSYSNPVDLGGPAGLQPSDLLPFYHDRHAKNGQRQPIMYQLVPVKKPQPEYTFHDAIKDTLYKVKDSVTHGVTKFKNVLGFNGFSEKISSPDALLTVAPVAAGLLAGGLAVAYLASRSGSRSNVTHSPFNFFGKRSARGIMNEEGLNLIVSRLDPVQREYLQKLQLYGPQRWKDTNCAKFIFCDVMSKATPFHIFDMQRKVGVFLSRMDEATARYVEMILKDVMLGIQARDCSRFSCAQAPWGLPSGGPMQHMFPSPQQVHHFQPFNGHNFIRRQ